MVIMADGLILPLSGIPFRKGTFVFGGIDNHYDKGIILNTILWRCKMPFSDEIVERAWKRSGGVCECIRIKHTQSGRCKQ
jgi:hypothetical protein